MTDSSTWADSVFKHLNLEERIGQLFMIAAYPEQGKSDVRRVSELIRKYRVGGIIFFRGEAEQIKELAAYYQSQSEVPLLIAIDGEWGPAMRVTNSISYPRQMMLGAIDDNDLLYDMGRDVGIQLRMLGIHINFAPVVDVNNNPDNPVIGSRSFGETRENVARKGIMYMRGMQDEKIIAVAKHFPGHGDTDKDSHHELPHLTQSRHRLDSIELFPFKALIESGIGGVMMAHLNVPELDTSPNMPSTLSVLITDSLLKKRMHFKGLIFTDAMTMQGVTSLYEPCEANLKALQAGNDILLMPEDIPRSMEEILFAARDSVKFMEMLNTSCKKVLEAKFWAVKPFLDEKPLDNKALVDSLNSPYFELVRRRLIEGSLTVIRNKYDLLPLKDLDRWKLASVRIGSASSASFFNTLSQYTDIADFEINSLPDSATEEQLLDTLKNYDLVLLSLHTDDFRAYRQFGFSDKELGFIDRILASSPAILTAFSSPYLLSKLYHLNLLQAIVLAYENDPTTQSLAAQLIFGALPATAHLPVSINEEFPAGKGLYLRNANRLKYTIPLEAGFSEEKLAKIDSLVYDGIAQKAMPGCQVLIARDGKVFWNKSYGYHTYDQERQVENSDLYDLASLTKIIATVPAIMYLEDAHTIDIKKPLATYLPELDTTNKAEMKIDDILLHQAGLVSWIPFYQHYLEPLYPGQNFASARYSKQYPIRIGRHFYVNKHLKYTPESFSRTREGIYTQQVADGFYMNPSLVDSIYLTIYASEVKEDPEYLYSDLGFYLFYKMIERVSQKSFDHYVDSLFYKPLGMSTMGFRPLERFPAERITPTENDLIFRRQIVHGYVHDPGAAMLGGISGHAGLFSNANDLAKFSQMLMNKGTYGGERYLDRKLIEKYTECEECKNGNRRGLGFDKPEPDTTKGSPACDGISLKSFGHTGFTGTMVWMDPATGVLYIFLSNRVYPDAAINKLAEMDIRTNIQKAIYEAME